MAERLTQTEENILLMQEAAREARPVIGSLDEVKAKAARLVAIEAELANMAKREQDLKKERERIRTSELPSMMFQLEITSIGVSNRTVLIGPNIQASLPKDADKRDVALKWIIDAKEGGIIKRSLELDLPKGDAVIEHRIVDALRKVHSSLNPRIEASIHHSTYVALARRLAASGKPFPADVLGIFVGQIAWVEE